jgi:hypothetical protein
LGTVIPIHKKGNGESCENYKRITNCIYFRSHIYTGEGITDWLQVIKQNILKKTLLLNLICGRSGDCGADHSGRAV